MRRIVLVVGVSSIVAGFAIMSWVHFGAEDHAKGAAVKGRFGTAVDIRPSQAAAGLSNAPRLRLKDDTRKRMGSFELRSGAKIGVVTADTEDGMACLIEQGSEGEASSCLDAGFFKQKRIEFLESSDGGPDRFSRLHISGIVAPGVRGAKLVKTDGTQVDLSLSSDGAFVFESPASDLDRAIYPSGFRLYGPSGRLVQTVSFPPGPGA